jgi:hypothetical protein
MLDGFNAGWITFEGHPIRGTVELDTVLRGPLGYTNSSPTAADRPSHT